VKRSKLFVPSITLDKDAAEPLHRQIQCQIARAIRSAEIPGGSRLPSSRVMARLLGVSRNTVLAAFEELAADDLLRAEKGSGTRVRGATPATDVTWFGLHRVIRTSGYPARKLALTDPDGNPIYLNF
jgi:DNA-binding GntR family transcriptional regulator